VLPHRRLAGAAPRPQAHAPSPPPPPLSLQISFIDYMRDGTRVMLKLDLGIKVAPLFLLRYHVPCIVLLEFR